MKKEGLLRFCHYIHCLHGRRRAATFVFKRYRKCIGRFKCFHFLYLHFADFLYTYIPQKSKYDLQQLINHLSGDLQEMKLFVAQSNSLATRKQPTNGVAFIHYNDVSHSHQD